MEHFVLKLGVQLVKEGVISEKEMINLQDAFKDSPKEYFDEFLLDEGIVDEPDLLRALGQVYKIPAYDVTGHFFEHHLLHMFPKDFLLRNAIIPLEVDENIMVIVANEPEAPGLESSIRGFVSYDITFRVGIRRLICDAVKEYYDKSPSEVPMDIDSRAEHRLEEEAEQLEDNPEGFLTEEEKD